MIQRVSYSNISTFIGCPRKWKLTYIDKLDSRSDSIDSIFGTAIHEAVQEFLKFYYSNNNVTVFGDREKTYNKHFMVFLDSMAHEFKQKQFETDDETLQKYIGYGAEIMQEFISKTQKNFPKQNTQLYGIELELNENDDWLGQTLFRGYVDLILKNTKQNTYKIIDLKTSMRTWTPNQMKDENRRMQLILYKYFFAKKLGVPLENVDVEFFILKKMIFKNTKFPMSRIQKYTPPHSNRTVNKTMERVKQTFQEMKELVRSGGEGQIRVNNYCKWCPYYQREDLCDRKSRRKTKKKEE